MNQFIARIANYVANELFIKGLANSKTFQKLAVRTDAQIRNMKNMSDETINSKLDELHKAASQQAYSTSSGSGGSKAGGFHTSTKGGGPPSPPQRGVVGFFSALGKVIRRDFGGGVGS